MGRKGGLSTGDESGEERARQHSLRYRRLVKSLLCRMLSRLIFSNELWSQKDWYLIWEKCMRSGLSGFVLVENITKKQYEQSQERFQSRGELEQRAAVMGGGNFVVPVQTTTDFLENELTIKFVPSSSYRIGLKASFHELFPAHITEVP